jgi:hypothetical protein
MSAYTWPDGTRKSQGNAFHWQDKPSLWAKPTLGEKVALAQAGKPTTPGRSITIYSRAKPKGGA